MLKAGGKRFRPMLFKCSKIKQKSVIVKLFCSCIRFGVLHTYSLVHDDLPAMDNADLRRGFQTIHKNMMK